MMTVLCNAGPLIALGKLNRLELLAELNGQGPHSARAVYDEAVTQGLALGMPDAHTIRLFWRSEGWLIIQVAADTLAAYMPPVIPETEVLALALTLSEPKFSPSRN